MDPELETNVQFSAIPAGTEEDIQTATLNS
jgi:hypothetical protein